VRKAIAFYELEVVIIEIRDAGHGSGYIGSMANPSCQSQIKIRSREREKQSCKGLKEGLTIEIALGAWDVSRFNELAQHGRRQLLISLCPNLSMKKVYKSSGARGVVWSLIFC